MSFYILELGDIVEVPIKEWTRWMKKANRHVGLDTIGDFRVSTIFEGIAPRFETMVFKKKSFGSVFSRRCATLEQAKAQHAEICDKVRKHELQFDDETLFPDA